MEMRRSVAVASAAILTQAACASTTYRPRPDGRIAMALEDGRQVLVKDGKTYPYGGDGLLEAVAGNPTAEEHARNYSSDMHIALAEELIGFGALVAGAIVAAPSQDSNNKTIPASNERQTGGAILGIAGLVAIIVASVQIGSAQAHFMDAVNIYNDGAPPRLPPGYQPRSPVPLPPPATPPAVPPEPPPEPAPPEPQVTPAPAYPPPPRN
jgi:hypothetical protein